MDPFKPINITLNPNGTVTRCLSIPPQIPLSPDPNLPTPVLSKDITINESNKTWARVYLPVKAVDYPPNSKLPIIVMFHGGGFIFFNSTCNHDFCVNFANHTQSVVVSFHLDPDLPLWYDHSVEVLHWIKTSNEPWLRHADYSRCFLMGESAGGNIAYTAGLRAAAEVDQIKPLEIKALVLIQPVFGGTKRSPSQVRLFEDDTLPLIITDLMWNLSLPVGVDRDYEYSIPTVNGGAEILDKIKGLGCEGDPLVDRKKELVDLLHAKGVDVVGQYYKGESESFLQKAIEKQGRGRIEDTISEIQERHDSMKELEKNLKELHEVFMDMAVLVQSQGEQLNDIESHVARANSFLRSGTQQLQTASKHHKESPSCAIQCIILFILIGLVSVSVKFVWK